MACLNVNGFLDKAKQLSVKNLVTDYSVSILCLQETHFHSETEASNAFQNFSGELFNSINDRTNRSCGVSVWFSSKLNYNIINTKTDKGGRIISLLLNIDDVKCNIINVYCPNIPVERRIFMSNISSYILCDDAPLFIMGDFNCLESFNDKIGGSTTWKGCLIGAEELRTIKTSRSLCDVYKHLYPAQSDIIYTHHSNRYKMHSRIDRIYCSKYFMSHVKDFIVVRNHSSDHDMLQINVVFSNNRSKQGPGIWKFNNSLLNDENFCNLVKTFWNEWQTLLEQYKSPLIWWDLGKFHLKSLIQNFCKAKASDDRKHKQYLQEQYKTALSKSEHGDNSVNDYIMYLQNELNVYDKQLLNGYQIRCHIRYREEGERLTPYFINLEKRRGHKQYIDSLRTSTGALVTDNRSIIREVSKYYQDLYSAEAIDHEAQQLLLENVASSLTKGQSSACEGEISYSEATKAIFSFDNDKSPGSDGFGALFYKHFWQLLGPDVVYVLNYALSSGVLSVSQRQGIIVLLYKKGDNALLKNWRPISLLNIDYKIMTKVLSNRLRTVLPFIINTDQTGAVPGRSIAQSISLTRDIIDYCNHKDIGGAILSLDQAKAFDKISWSFMYKALEKFGFGPNFIAWIKLCYTDISSAVKVNGYLSEYFKLERGVRQGCCLSMGLYTIVAEYIAAMIRNEPKIKGILLPNNVECKLSQYVDDTQIFISDVSSTDTVLSSFRLIQAATGASLNLEKTEGLWLGSFKGRQDKPGNMKWSSDSIKVLGVHVGNLDQSEANWSLRIEKFCCALNMWSQRDLSVYGKSIVANVIASSKLWYYSNVLYVPDWVIAKLSSLIVEFMWSNKRHLVSKQVLCMPFERGGLNIVNICNKINAQRIVWISKMLTSNHKCSVLFNYFIGLYRNGLFGSDILNLEYTVNYANCISMPIIYREFLIAWNKIDIYLEETPLKKCDILKETLFMNNRITLENYNTLWADEFVQSNVLYVSDIWDEGCLDFMSFDEFCISNYFEYTIQSRNMYSKIISCIPDVWKILLKSRHYSTDISSKLYYVLLNNRKVYHNKFSCKMIYRLLQQDVTPNSLHKWNDIFNTDLNVCHIFRNVHRGINDKYQLQLYWKFLHLSLPTKDILLKSKITSDNICPFCPEIETNIHLIVDCLVAFKLWSKLEVMFKCLTGQQCNLLTFYTVCFNFDHLWKTLSGKCITLCNYLLVTARYSLWRHRNLKLKHSNYICNPLSIFIHTVEARIKQEHKAAEKDECRKMTFKKLWCFNHVLCETDEYFVLKLNIRLLLD